MACLPLVLRMVMATMVALSFLRLREHNFLDIPLGEMSG